MNGQQPQLQFTPDLVYNLIASSPQGRSFVENLAKMAQLQQGLQQFAPQLQQFTQNPVQAISELGQWAQSAAQYHQPQPEVQPVQQQGGAGMLGMVSEVINKFEVTLHRIEQSVNAMSEANNQIVAQVAALVEESKVLTCELAEVRSDVQKLAKPSAIAVAK